MIDSLSIEVNALYIYIYIYRERERGMMQFPCQKNILEKTDQIWRKDIQLTPHVDLKKNKQLEMVFRTNRRFLKYAPKNFRKSTSARGIHLNVIKTHNIPDNTDHLLTPTRSDTY